MRTWTFMLCLAVVAALMIPPTPPEFRWVNIFLVALAGFWAVMFGIEDFLNRRRRGVQEEGKQVSPGFEGDASDIFAPPPPPRRRRER